MSKGVTLANIDPVIKQAELDNMPGIVSKLIYGYHADVAAWPTKPVGVADADITLDAAGALVGDVVMKSGTCAFVDEFTEDTGEFSIKWVGENGGLHAEYDLSIVHAKIRAKILGLQNASRNRKLFFIVQDENGSSYLMGDKNKSAIFQPSDGNKFGKSGSAERNQATLAFKYSAPRALEYVGDTEDLLVVAN